MTNQRPRYHGYRFPPEIIGHAVWLYHRFCLSFRDTEDLLAQRGIAISYETIRQWSGPSTQPMRGRFGNDAAGWVTRGIWTNSSSRFKGGSSTCGEPWTKTVT
jgi:hypothetical protein